MQKLLTLSRAEHFARGASVFWLLAFAVMNITAMTEARIGRWLEGHAFGFINGLDAISVGYAVGAMQLVAALLLAAGLKSRRLTRIGAGILIALSLGALSLMFTNPVWIDSIGGFPAIGAGQGIIKYVSIAGLGLWLYGRASDGRSVDFAQQTMIVGILLVLVWIGGMKFTLPEAQGVEGLLKTSPLFSWITVMLPDIQAASAFIGVIELIAAAALLGWFYKNKQHFYTGAVITAITLFGTLSFFLTLERAWTPEGFPFMSGSGHFLLKDLVMLAALYVLVATRREETAKA